MNVQSATNLTIPDGSVKAIHDSNGDQLWGAVTYNPEYGGNTHQQTYSGKNLLGTQTTSNIYQTTIVTNTVNELALKPTAGGNSFIECTIPASASAQYTASMDIATTGVPSGSTYAGTVYWYSINSGGTSSYIDGVTKNGHRTKTFTTKADTVSLKFRFFACELVDSGWENIQSTYSNIQLESGSTETSFEPYTGGIPAPNPDYPQDIEVATGRQVVTMGSKNFVEVYNTNLFDGMSSIGTNNGLTTTISSDGTLSSSGQATSTYSTFTNNKTVSISNGTTITLSTSNNVTASLGLILFGSNWTNRQDLMIPVGQKSATITTNSDKVYISLWVNGLTAGTQYNLTFNDVQIKLNSVTKNGVTLTVNPDGTIKLNGTSTGDSWLEFCGAFTSSPAVMTTPLQKLDTSKSYTLSYKVVSGSAQNSGSYMVLQYGYPSDEKFLLVDSTSPITTTFTGKDGVYRMWIRSYSGVVYNNLVLGVQVEEGSTVTAFEPYRTKDYEINLGKNLFNKNTITSGYLVDRTTGNLLANPSYGASDFIPVVAGETYTFSGFDYWYTAAYDKNNTYVSNVDNTKSITIPDGVSYIRASLNLANLDIAQFEKGWVTTTYAPYISHFGKNLFNKDSVNITLDKYLSANGTETTDSGWEISEYIPIVGGMTYTTSGTGGDFGNLPARCYYTANKTFISGVQHGWASPFTDTAPANAVYMRETIRKTLTSVQIEQGSTATPYQPFIGGQLELCKIGTYQDYIYKSGNDWYVHKGTGKVILNGGEGDWSKSTAITTVNRYRTMTVPARAFNTSTVYCMSSHEVGINSADSDSGALGVSARFANNGGLFFCTPIGVGDNTTSFETWLSNNNPTVYYALATPTDIQITNADLIAQLEAVNDWERRYGYRTEADGDLPIIINRPPLS